MTKSSYPPPIRKLDPRKDLLAIADLIELCFAESLDQSGRDYIRQLRQVAKDASSFWIGISTNHLYAPREGFVWEEGGKIIGNLSIFPFQTSQGVEYLIANVAVHPNFRRRGIARLLTECALDSIRERGGRRAWLNVRADNQAAYSLYRQLDFSERLRRTHWQYRPSSNAFPKWPSQPIRNPSTSVQIRRRTRSEWELQKRWLLATYPQEYHWHLDFHLDGFAPGFFAWLRGFLNDLRYQHFSILKNQHLIGVATLQSSAREGQVLWVACHPQWEDEALQAFLSHYFNLQAVRGKISLDYPAQRAAPVLQEFGFTPVQTLVWMQRSLTQTELI